MTYIDKYRYCSLSDKLRCDKCYCGIACSLKIAMVSVQIPLLCYTGVWDVTMLQRSQETVCQISEVGHGTAKMTDNKGRGID